MRAQGGASGGGGEFGLAARPVNQTCRPPARFTAPAETLRATGCVDANDPTRPAAGLIPYVVASPLWSDGAAKQRFLALPEGAKIRVSDPEGHFELPVGTVLMKHFLFAQKIFETRLFIRFSETRWAGYSYAWNAEHTDAVLVGQDGVYREVANDAGVMQGWSFPSQNDCLLCHNPAAGFSLGLEVRQLNLDHRYPSGVTSNQLATFAHIGLLDAPIAAPAPPLPDPAATSAASLEARARSYLHANCANCHRPEGKFPGLDLRVDVPLGAMGICQTDSTKGSAGAVSPAQRLVPGHPEQSTMYTRMASLERDARMPQVATAVVDPIGTPLVAEWIKSIAACP